MIKSAFTIDVECGVNICMRDYFNIQMPPTERVITNTRIILRLLHQHQARATFFVLGDVAKHYPALVKEIAADGHEIGVHSYAHYQLFRLTEKEAYEDTRHAKEVIENILGKKVSGFRAPAFSVMPKTSWALPMLADLGFTFDSSIMPVKTDRYGWPGFSKEITKIDLPDGKSIIEFPLSTTALLGRQFPACGGGYLKWFPLWFTAKIFASINKTKPVNLYIHPYEVDTNKYPDYFYAEMEKQPFLRKLKMKTFPVNKDTVLNKLDRLLHAYRFDTMINIIEDHTRNGKVQSISLTQLLAQQ